MTLRGANVVVLGLAVTGRVAARVLADAGANVLASDAGDVAVDDLEGVEVETGTHERARKALPDADFVLPSPGIPPHAALLAEAIARGVRVVSELDLAQQMTDATIVAVTGTKGKTTVCRLVERMVPNAYACGNNDVPFLQAVVEHPDANAFVVEASSFRLYFCETFHPRVAVITNFAPDHLDWHVSMDDYRDAKARIAQNQRVGDTFIYPATQPELADFPKDPDVARLSFGAEESAAIRLEGDEVLLDGVRIRGLESLARRGPHFALDGAAAAGAALRAGAAPDAVERGLAGFVPDRHRLELVGERGGVRFYEDSAATNPLAAIAALRSFDVPIVLIAGGRKKVPDMSALRDEAGRLRSVVVMGEAAGDVAAVFEETPVPVERAADMRGAVERAVAAAKPGDVVLLAPACASMDAYSSYVQRGEDFVRTCRLLGVS